MICFLTREDFSLLQNAQTDPVGHPLPYSMVTGHSFHRGKAAGAWR